MALVHFIKVLPISVTTSGDMNPIDGAFCAHESVVNIREINAKTDFVLQNFILNKNSLYSHNKFNLEQRNKNMNSRILRKQIGTNLTLFVVCTFSFQTLLRHPQ